MHTMVRKLSSLIAFDPEAIPVARKVNSRKGLSDDFVAGT